MTTEVNVSGKRIAKNTALLYVRMLVIMIINLFTVRVVLKALGAENYGIFDVVAGVVTIMASFEHVLGGATSRYFSFYLGAKDKNKLNEAFSNSIIIYSIFALIVLVLAETVGLWFVNTHLNIPTERMNAANWVFQFSIFSFIFSILRTPFSSIVTSHEDINIYAIITTVEWVLKLAFALTITLVPFDQLIYYAAYLMVIPLLALIVYIVISYKKYEECRKLTKLTSMYKQMLSFSGWMLFASLAGVGMIQVNTILVNIFFSPIVNAARAIALQINSAVGSFSSSFLTAVKPPMIKAYADEDYSNLNRLFDASNKFILYSMLIVCIPLFTEMDYVLKIWLDVTDAQTILFSRLTLVYAFIMVLNNPISFIMHATGHVKEYHTRVEIPTILCMPLTWLLFAVGLPAYTSFLVMIAVALASHIIRMFCLRKFYPHFSIRYYLSKIISPAFVIGLISTLVALFVHDCVENDILRLGAVILTSIIITCALVYLFALSKYEKNIISVFVKKITHG